MDKIKPFSAPCLNSGANQPEVASRYPDDTHVKMTGYHGDIGVIFR
jgi:hypothetical protein